MEFPFSHVTTFSGQLYFRRSFFMLLQSNYFEIMVEIMVTFYKQLFLQGWLVLFCFVFFLFVFWGAPFSEQSLICSIYFFRIFSSYFFGVNLLPSSHHPRKGSFLGSGKWSKLEQIKHKIQKFLKSKKSLNP